jgi:hypothetical protein
MFAYPIYQPSYKRDMVYTGHKPGLFKSGKNTFDSHPEDYFMEVSHSRIPGQRNSVEPSLGAPPLQGKKDDDTAPMKELMDSNPKNSNNQYLVIGVILLIAFML